MPKLNLAVDIAEAAEEGDRSSKPLKARSTADRQRHRRQAGDRFELPSAVDSTTSCSWRSTCCISTATIRCMPLEERRHILEDLIEPAHEPIRFSEAMQGDGRPSAEVKPCLRSDLMALRSPISLHASPDGDATGLLRISLITSVRGRRAHHWQLWDIDSMGW